MGVAAAILEWGTRTLSRLPVLGGMYRHKLLAVKRRDAVWATLMSKTPWFDIPFDNKKLESLPEPAQRFLRHAIPAGAPLRTVAVVATTTASGSEAHTIIAAPHGWLRRSYSGPVSEVHGICGAEHLEQRWWGKIIPIDPEPTDLAQRAAMETVLWVPTALCGTGVTWTGIDENTAQLGLCWGDRTTLLTIKVAEGGELISILGAHGTAVPTAFAMVGGLRVPSIVQIGEDKVSLRQIRLVPPYKGHSHA